MLLERVRGWTTAGVEAARRVRDAGLLQPIRPDRVVRLPLPYLRYGPTPASIAAMAALRFPDRIALVDERGELTHAELDRAAAALAAALHDRLNTGVEAGRIGLLCRNHRGFVQGLLASTRIGADVVLLNTGFSATQLGEVLDREGIDLLLHDEEFEDTVNESSYKGDRLLAWAEADTAARDTIDGLVASTAPRSLPRPGKPSTVVILTSGTTGTPKGARHDISAGAMILVAFTHLNRVALRSGEPLVIGPPLFHILGLAYTMVGLVLGMPLVLSRRFDPSAVLAAIERHRAGGFVGVPLMLQRLLEHKKAHDTSSLRVVICGGAALRPQLSEAFMDAFGEVLHNVYGATETGWATIATPTDLRAMPGTVGRPSLHLTIKILDKDGTELPTGETGEIHVGGGLRFAGYTGGGGDQRTQGGLIATGDLGHFDEAGRLFIDGRTDDMIVSGGENVFPAEVEDILHRHEAVAEAAVTGVPDDEFGERLAAYVVRVRDGNVTADELKTYVKHHLAGYKVPRDITFVDELPRTTTGKVRTRALS